MLMFHVEHREGKESTVSTQKPQQRRLGRGLSSLLGVSDLPVTGTIEPGGATASPLPGTLPVSDATAGPLEVEVNQIVPNPHQPRRKFSEQSIAELAASMKAAGLIQPIIVRKVESGYQLIAGERRWRAAKLAGITTLPVIVRDVDAYTQAQMALIENIQREDLNPLDRAESYRSLMTQLGLTQAELAGRLGEDRSSIANYLRLLDLSESVRQRVREGSLSLGHAKILAGIADPVEQERLAQLILRQDLSVRNLERVIQSGAPSDKPDTKSTQQSAHLAEIERSVTQQIGLRVQVRSVPRKGKGRLVIHYANLDQFDELMRRLGVQLET
jgi:ParB family chromosome partitioning protein